MRVRSLIVFLFCLTAIPAAAAPLTIVDVLAGDEVQQTDNNPCIFGDASCDPGLLGTYTEFPTGGGSQTYQESQSYSIETIRTAIGNVFDIGVDVNTTEAATDTLDYFRVYNASTSTLLFSFEGDTNVEANGAARGDARQVDCLKEPIGPSSAILEIHRGR